MATWDLLFKDALIFDGRAERPTFGDLAIAEGRVAARGDDLDAAEADRVVDASGQWLMPGLLDIHTHYDLEVELEPWLPESLRHGTTTVVMSNCSIGAAFGAQRDKGGDPIVDCFARVENMPKHILERAADRASEWDNPHDYLSHLDELPLGMNVVPLIPHSMLRIEVMGFDASIERDPTDEELDEMCAVLEEAMEAGYVGFSTDALPFHYLANDPNRHKKIPTQYGTYREIRRLTEIVRRHDGVWQATPPKDSPPDILRNFLLSSGRLYGKPLRITAVAALDVVSNRTLGMMGRVLTRILNSKFVDGNFRLQALPAPFKVWSEGPITPLAEEIPELRELNAPDLDDRAARMEVLDDPQWRRRFREMWYDGKRGFGLSRIKRWLRAEDHTLTRDLGDMFIDTCPVEVWNGASMQEVYDRLQAYRRGDEQPRSTDEELVFDSFPDELDDAEFFMHLLRRFDMELYWYTYGANTDPEALEGLVMDDQMLPGFSDSGAHITNMAFYDVNLRALRMAQRSSLERVAYTVRRLTREPAEFFGIEAGGIDEGDVADVILVDPKALSRYESESHTASIYRDAFEHHQLVNRSDGVVPIVVKGGRVVFEDGDFAEQLGRERVGRALRRARA